MIRSFVFVAILTFLSGCHSTSTCEFSPTERGWTRVDAPEGLPDNRNALDNDWYVTDQGEFVFCPGRFGVCGTYYRTYEPTGDGFAVKEEIVCTE